MDPWLLSQPWFPHLHLFVDPSRIIPYLQDLMSQQGYQGMSQTASRTICMHGSSHAALPRSRIFNTVFLTAMASAGRRRELQALVFDLQHINLT